MTKTPAVLVGGTWINGGDLDEQHLDLLRVLQRVHTYSFTTKSNLAREYADEIAAGASRGFLTVSVVPGGSLYGTRWKVTPLGLLFLEHGAAAIAADEERKFLQRDQELNTGAAVEG